MEHDNAASAPKNPERDAFTCGNVSRLLMCLDLVRPASAKVYPVKRPSAVPLHVHASNPISMAYLT